MTWAAPKTDLRTLLSDGATDKLRYRQKMIGRVDGTNTRFKTLEKRRVTNFKTEASTTLGVFINGVRLSEVTGITADVIEVGEVQLTAAPLNGQYVEASFYVQWFLDSELDIFLQQAANWLGFGTAVQVPPGLQPSAMYYAAQEAYHKLAVRWAETLSSEFRLEDMPGKDTQTPMEMYRRLAEDAKKKSVELRNQYYKGQGQEQKPNFASITGCVPRVAPNR